MKVSKLFAHDAFLVTDAEGKGIKFSYKNLKWCVGERWMKVDVAD